MSERESITLLSYNIDGLNPVNLQYRTHNALALIISENPDVIQLQEVIHETAPVLATTLSCNGYSTLPDLSMGMCHYFTMSFYKKDKFQNARLTRMPYAGSAASQQGRDSLQLELSHHGSRLLFINCHLESCGAAFKSPGSAIRIAQLRNGLQKLCDHAETGPAILAGDLNIREPEAAAVTSGFVGAITDASSALERRPSNTWFIPGPSRFSARYDRVYSNTASGLAPKTFKVIGGEDIYPPGGQAEFGKYEQLPYRTISDHRGLVVTFEFTAALEGKSNQPELGVTVEDGGGAGASNTQGGHGGSSGVAGGNTSRSASATASGFSGGNAGCGGGAVHAKLSDSGAIGSGQLTGSEGSVAGKGLGKRAYEETKSTVPVGVEVICLDSDSEDENSYKNKHRNAVPAKSAVSAEARAAVKKGTIPEEGAVLAGTSCADSGVGGGVDNQEERRRRRELMLRAAEARCG